MSDVRSPSRGLGSFELPLGRVCISVRDSIFGIA